MIIDRVVLSAMALEGRSLLSRAYTNVRGNVRRLGQSVRGLVTRLGDRAESYAAAKIRRRVKPPIIAALALGAAALVIAIVAVIRK